MFNIAKKTLIIIILGIILALVIGGGVRYFIEKSTDKEIKEVKKDAPKVLTDNQAQSSATSKLLYRFTGNCEKGSGQGQWFYVDTQPISSPKLLEDCTGDLSFRGWINNETILFESFKTKKYEILDLKSGKAQSVLINGKLLSSLDGYKQRAILDIGLQEVLNSDQLFQIIDNLQLPNKTYNVIRLSKDQEKILLVTEEVTDQIIDLGGGIKMPVFKYKFLQIDVKSEEYKSLVTVISDPNLSITISGVRFLNDDIVLIRRHDTLKRKFQYSLLNLADNSLVEKKIISISPDMIRDIEVKGDTIYFIGEESPEALSALNEFKKYLIGSLTEFSVKLINTKLLDFPQKSPYAIYNINGGNVSYEGYLYINYQSIEDDSCALYLFDLENNIKKTIVDRCFIHDVHWSQ